MSKSSQPHRVPPYRRPIIVGGFLLILAAVVLVTVLIFKSINQPIDDTPQISNPDTSTSRPSENPQPSDEPQPEDKAPQYEGEDPNDFAELTGVIVYKDIDPETLAFHSAVSINQYLEQGGQCVFNIRRGDAIYRTTSAAITPDITTSVCGPFNISLDGLDSGAYVIEVIMTSEGRRGVITDEIQI